MHPIVQASCLHYGRQEEIAMRRRAATIVVALWTLIVLCGQLMAAPFEDKNLEAAVLAALNDPKATLNDDTLAKVFVLHANGKNIGNLIGLEKCKNLQEIRLAKNAIVDLAPLKDLKNLQSLDLAGNKIVDPGPLAGLTRLQYLELSNNQIAKIDSLAGLTNLSALYLSGNKITDIAPVGGLSKLSSLYLAGNQIKDIGALAKVTRVMTLDLKENQIVDLSPLTKHTDVRLLMLERNKIADLTPLVALAEADIKGDKRVAPYLRLFLSGNPLSDAAKTTQLEALKKTGVRIEN
jgi:Leucine-rich repeat (LRR) protein